MARVKELFFYVSGEHETLPFAEIKAILEAEVFSYNTTVVSPRLLCIKSDVKCLFSVANRSCLTKACGLVVLKCTALEEEILIVTEEANYSDFINNGDTFSVEVTNITRQKIDTCKLESIIGEKILRKIQQIKVKLRYPDIRFFGMISDNVFVLGVKLFEPSKKFIKEKSNRLPFTHPSSMSSRLARVIVNLARTRRRDLVLDPFCGTGSILIEAGRIGCRTLGSDISVDMINGTVRNLSYSNISWEGLVDSEAGHLPFTNIDRIVTDPPYGRASSTHGMSTKEITRNFLAEALDILPSQGFVSIVLPSTIETEVITEDLGYVNIENYCVREHKSLTRKISIIQKP